MSRSNEVSDFGQSRIDSGFQLAQKRKITQTGTYKNSSVASSALQNIASRRYTGHTRSRRKLPIHELKVIINYIFIACVNANRLL